MQKVSFIIVIGMDIVIYSLEIIFPKSAIIFEKIYVFNQLFLYWFLISNQLWWFIMSTHLRIYIQTFRAVSITKTSQARNERSIKVNKAYIYSKKRIRKIEMGGLILMLLFLLSYGAICTFRLVAQIIGKWEIIKQQKLDWKKTGLWNTAKTIRTVQGYIDIALYLILIVSCITTYMFLKKSLKTNLHHYYSSSRKMLAFLMISDCLYFLSLLGSNGILLLIDKRLNSLPHLALYAKLSKVQIWAILGSIILQTIPLYLSAFYNIHGINFKQYLKTVLKGYNIKKLYVVNPSLFLWVKEGDRNTETSGNISDSEIM